jgi:cell division transport system permease protein
MLRAIFYFLSEGFSGLVKHKSANLFSVAVIGISLYVVGIFLLVDANLSRVVFHWQEEVQMNVFLKPGVARADLTRIEDRIKRSPMVADYRFISEREALARFKEFFPSLTPLLSDLKKVPFPASFEIAIDPDYQQPKFIEEFNQAVSRLPGVDEVACDLTWIDRLKAVSRLLKLSGIFFGGVLILAAISTAANVIKLLVYARRDEIEIMRLVGASNSYIKGPFVVEGMVQGFLAGLLALGLLFLSYHIVRPYLASSFVSEFLVAIFLSKKTALGIVIGGGVVGMAASFFSLGRLIEV